MNERLGASPVNLELTVNQINALLTAMNNPNQTPTMIWAELFIEINNQVVPQIEKLKATFEAIKNADGVSKDLEEKN